MPCCFSADVWGLEVDILTLCLSEALEVRWVSEQHQHRRRSSGEIDYLAMVVVVAAVS